AVAGRYGSLARQEVASKYVASKRIQPNAGSDSMTETAKTWTYLGTAFAVLAIALLTTPRPASDASESMIGKLLNEVSDPLLAKKLEIVEYMPDTATIKNFEVAEVEGRWVIPSQQNYP